MVHISSQPVLTPIQVDAPIVQQCKIPSVAAPKWPTEAIKKTDSTFDKVKAALAELKLRSAYEKQILAAQEACQ